MQFSRLIIISLCFFSVVLGCSTTQKIQTTKFEHYPPDVANWPINATLFSDKDFESIDIFLSRVVKEQPGENTNWWADYRRAQLWESKDKNVSCENYSRLAADANFPLRRLAYLKAHELCPVENQILTRLEPFSVDSFDPWLGRKALDVAILKTKRSRHRRELMELLTKKSKLNIRKSKKVELAEDALKIARRLKDTKQIQSLTQRVRNLAPSKDPNIHWRNYINAANDFRYYSDYPQAKKYYRKAIANKRISPQEKLSAFRGIRSIYKMELNPDQAVKATEQMLSYVEKEYKKRKSKFTDEQLLDSYLYLARTYWTNDQRNKAESTLAKAEKKLKKKLALPELHWIRGRMAEEKQDFKNAVAMYDKALGESKISNTMSERIRWYRAWSLRKLKNYVLAAEELEKLKDNTDNDYDRARYAYWHARTLADSGDIKSSKIELKKLVNTEPLNYYGFIAHRDLGEPLPAKSIERDVANLAGKDIQIPRDLKNIINPAYLEWLIALKENEVAEDYLNEIVSEYRKSKSNEVDSWQTILQYYARSGNYQTLYTQLYALDGEIRKTIVEDRIDLIYPRPYAEVVSESADRFGISAEFIYSIMRQESSFNPQARSNMDAFGLMQLLPKVAKASAHANTLQYDNPEDLFEPRINIPIGSAHLRELWDKYNGDLVLAVASYNASEKAILGWLRTRYRGDTVEFIEDIPYDETRDYVKLVLRNMLAYRTLNAKTEFIEFPEWTLKISALTED